MDKLQTTFKQSWGLIGSSEVARYSIAPKMWNSLFNDLNFNIDYFVNGEDNSSEIKNLLKEKISSKNFIGCNIAMPWKSSFLDLCDYVEAVAKKTNTINTIIKKNDKLYGYNTDGEGLVNITKNLTNLKNKIVLLLGCGGSAQTLVYHLIENKVKEIILVDINIGKAILLKNKYLDFIQKNNIKLTVSNNINLKLYIKKTNILYNLNPCGMDGNPEKYPLDLKFLNYLNKNSIVIEAVYTPLKTPLISYCESLNLKTVPGIKMLVEQAALSFEYAFDKKLTNKEKLLMENSARKALTNIKKVSEVEIITSGINQEILEDSINSSYKIKIKKKKITLPKHLDKFVDLNWSEFVKKNSKTAKNNDTFFLIKKEYQEVKKDEVWTNKFKYVQAFGKTELFQEFQEFSVKQNLIALSSLCLIKTNDDKIILGLKKNMNNKISGFSGYMNNFDVENNQINIYRYLIRTLNDELSINKNHINSAHRIGQVYSPKVSDSNGNLNNHAYNNIFLVNLNISYDELKKIFRKNFQFSKLIPIENDSISIINYIDKNYESFSIHCIGAFYTYLEALYGQEKAKLLKNKLPFGSIILKNE